MPVLQTAAFLATFITASSTEHKCNIAVQEGFKSCNPYYACSELFGRRSYLDCTARVPWCKDQQLKKYEECKKDPNKSTDAWLAWSRISEPDNEE